MSATAIWTTKLQDAMTYRWWLNENDIVALTGDVSALPDAVAQARAQKAALIWVKKKLDEDPSHNRWFKDKSEIAWLNKLLTAARLKELATTKITKIGSKSGLKYDIGGLGATFYGRKILDGLGFSHRRTRVDKAEFARIQQACFKIKLKLPQSVEPTTTERYFAPPETDEKDDA